MLALPRREPEAALLRPEATVKPGVVAAAMLMAMGGLAAALHQAQTEPVKMVA
jgi:hypothetical protein